MPDRTAILNALQRSGEEVSRKLRTISVEQFETGRYEGGWNARQILAHIASVEWTYPRLLATAANPRKTEGESKAPDARGGFDAYNARQVAKRNSVSPQELIAEFERNRRTTIQAVQDADERLFGVRIRSAGGARGTLGEVLLAVAVEHVEGHVHDIISVP